jgi:alpha-galactosidase
MSQRIVLIGAGSAQFGFDMLGDIFHSRLLAGSAVVLHDIDAAALRQVESAAAAFVREHRLPFAVSATTDRAAALQGADFCVIAIEVGDRFRLWEQDWRIPQQHGLRQVYGENGGPGGLFHALRIIPPILEICADIARLAPQACVFNYSNPMSRICTAVKRRFPALRIIGMCHEIASLARHLPRLLSTAPENLEYRAGGLNHFSVLTSVRYRDTGRDAYPEVRRLAPAYFQSMPETPELYAFLAAHGRLPGPAEEAELRRGARPWGERGLFRVILETYGCLPITTDSHFGEYLPWAHEVADHLGILHFYSWYKAACRAPRTLQVHAGGYEERFVPVVEGIVSDSGYEEPAVNVPNEGLIAGLPRDLVVEVPGRVDARGVTGVPLPEYPRGILGLLANQAAVHDLTAEAVLQRSRALALQALLADPVVDSLRAAERTLEAVLEAQAEHLGYLK